MGSEAPCCNFDGNHDHWEDFQKVVMDEINKAMRNSRKPLDVGALLNIVFRHLKAASDALLTATNIRKDFAAALLFVQAKERLYPMAVLPPGTAGLIRISKTTLGYDVDTLIQQVLDDTPVPDLYRDAYAVGRAQCADDRWPVKLQWLQGMRQAAQMGPVLKPEEKADPEAAAEAEAYALDAARVVAAEAEDLDYMGEAVSPALAVTHLFMAALRALFGIAGMAEKNAFLRMGRQGQQNSRSFAQFAAYCHSKWQAVKFLLPNAEHQLMHVFLTGLDEEASTSYARQQMSNVLPGQPAIELVDMVNRLQSNLQAKLLEHNAALLSATAGGADIHELQQLTQQGQKLMGGGKASSSSSLSSYRELYGNKVVDIVEGHFPGDSSKQEAVLKGYGVLLQDPTSPDALCCKDGHGLHQKRGKLHLSRNCTGSRQAQEKHVQFQGMAAQTPPAAPSSDFTQLSLRLDTLTDAVYAMGLQAAHDRAMPGLPRGQKLPRSRDPWGPGRATAIQGVERYISRCKQYGLTPQLSRCKEQVAQLYQQGRLNQ
eukprot:gene6389-6621_t